MRTLIPVALAGILLLGACHRSTTASRSQQQYDVVDEGSASGVSSTINAPGEAPPPPLTNTNADTTTSFTLSTVPANPELVGTQGTIGSTIQTTTVAPRQAPRPRPREQQPQQPVTATSTPPATDTTVTDTAGAPPEERPRTNKPPATDKPVEKPPATDTTTTTTAPPPTPPPSVQ